MLTIGEFSKLAHVSARMLRHYDMLGLLRPASVGPGNSYRYYSLAQLEDLRRIETLKAYGFSLAEIAGLLAGPEAALASAMHARRLAAYSELHEMRKALSAMESDIAKMEGASFMQENYKVTMMQNPPQTVFGVRDTISIGGVRDLFQRLKREAEARGLVRAGCTQLLYHGEEFSYESMDVEAQMEVNGEGEGVKTLPAAEFIATTHTGPYETIHFAYDALAVWMSQNPEYHICGPAIERYIVDEAMGAVPEEYQTGVLFQVTRG